MPELNATHTRPTPVEHARRANHRANHRANGRATRRATFASSPALTLACVAAAVLGACATADNRPDWRLALQAPWREIVGTAEFDPAMSRPAITAAGLVVAILETDAGPAIGVFDEDGALLDRVGRTGSGPGEFRSPRAVGLGPGDSIWVLEDGGRASVFSPHPELAFVRTIVVPLTSLAQVTERGLLSYETLRFANGELAVEPGRLFDWDGNATEELRPSWFDSTAASPSVGVSTVSGGLTWLARTNDYRVEALDPSGRVVHVVSQPVDWPTLFRDDGAPRDPAAPPAPRIVDLAAEGDSMLWVLIRRPSERWTPPATARSGFVAPLAPGSRRVPTIIDDQWESEVHVFDVRCADRPATATFRATVLGGFVAPGWVWRYGIEQDSLPQLWVSRVALLGSATVFCN